jgi:hypothetical protein
MAAKVQTKLEKLTARVGIFCAESYFRGFQLDKLINEVLGVRSKAHNGFQWNEVILPLFDTCLCGGDYLEDVSEIGRDLRLAPGSHVPSSDTIGRAIKELATDNINYTAKSSGKSYAFNTNPKLNSLLLESAIRVGLLKRGQMVDVDFDSLNNDFMWKHLPCSYLKENTVFMILMAICKNFFTAMMRRLAGTFRGITPNGRLKRFIFHFVTVPGKWIRTARTWVLKLYTDRPYDKLVFT